MGDFKEFKYQERRGLPRTAWLSDSYSPTLGGGTEDPKWFIRNPDNSVGNNYEWLTYLGTDGRIWKVKVHAQYNGAIQKIEIWLEHETEDGDIEHDDSRQFAIIDWEGNPVELEIDNNIPNHSAPGFKKWK